MFRPVFPNPVLRVPQKVHISAPAQLPNTGVALTKVQPFYMLTIIKDFFLAVPFMFCGFKKITENCVLHQMAYKKYMADQVAQNRFVGFLLSGSACAPEGWVLKGGRATPMMQWDCRTTTLENGTPTGSRSVMHRLEHSCLSWQNI